MLSHRNLILSDKTSPLAYGDLPWNKFHATTTTTSAMIPQQLLRPPDTCGSSVVGDGTVDMSGPS